MVHEEMKGKIPLNILDHFLYRMLTLVSSSMVDKELKL